MSESVRLVRWDLVEAWAPHAYSLEALPGMAAFVRRAAFGLLSDGTVIYQEVTTVGARGFQFKNGAAHSATWNRRSRCPSAFAPSRRSILAGLLIALSG